MIVYVENPKDFTKELIEPIKFSKVTEQKANVQKSTVFLYTCNECMEIKIKNAISFALRPKKRKETLRCKSNKTSIIKYHRLATRIKRITCV